MSQKSRCKSRFHCSGQSMIELAMILPILLLLCFGAAELSHAILFNNILINMSREGANLASRTTQSPQFIIDALNHTSAPLEMEAKGMLHASKAWMAALASSCRWLTSSTGRFMAMQH